MKHHGRTPIAIAMAACAGLLAAPVIHARQPHSVAGRPLLAVHEDAEPFLFQSPGRGNADIPAAFTGPIQDFFGVFMTREAQAEGGRKVIAQFKLRDPAPAIAEALGRETCPLLDCTMIVHAVENEALTLSVRTTNWSVSHLSFAWNRYRIAYKIDARILDAANDRVLASGEFVYNERYDDADRAPLLEDLLRDDAALLKSKFREVEPLAVAELKEEFEKDLRSAGLIATS